MQFNQSFAAVSGVILGVAMVAAGPPQARADAVAYQDPSAFFDALGPERTEVRFDVLTPDVVERQRLSASGSGTFRILHDSGQTTPIAFNASARGVEDALASVGSIGRGNIAVTQPSPSTWDLHFTGTLSGQDVPFIGVDLSGASAGSTTTLQTLAQGRIGDRVDGGFFRGVSLRRGGGGWLAVTDRLPGTPGTNYLTPEGGDGFGGGERLDMAFREPVNRVGLLVRAEGPLERGEMRLEIPDPDQPLVTTALGAGEPFSGSAGRVETQLLTPLNNPVFRIGIGDNLSQPMTADTLPPGRLQASLEALPAGGVGNLEVTGPVGGPWTIAYTGDLAGLDMPLPELDLSASPPGRTMSLIGLSSAAPSNQALYFVGIDRDEPFTEASLVFDASADGRYYIEQITHAVPEPATATLLLTALAATCLRRARKTAADKGEPARCRR